MVAFVAAAAVTGLLNVGVVAALKGIAAVTLAHFLIPAGLALASGFLLKVLSPSVDPQGLDLTGASARTIRSAVLPERWIVGRARVAGVLVWAHEEGRNFHAIYVLAAAPCDAVEEVWINGEKGDISVTGDAHALEGAAIRLTASRYAGDGVFQAQAYLNGSGFHALPENFSGAAPLPWTTAHRLTGLAFVYVRMHQPDYGTDLDDRVWSSLPELHFLLRGHRFTWPGQNEAAWTDNAAAVRYWWLTERRGIPADMIDRPLFDSALAVCAEQVTLSGLDGFSSDYPETITRYTYNGVITAGDRPEGVEANMDVAWAGYAPEFDGVHRFLPGADRPASATIAPGDIIAAPTFRPGPEQHERLNRITARIQQSSLHDWTEYALEALDDTDAQARDGEILQSDLGTLSFVADPVAGLNLLAIQLRRERAVRQIDLTLRPGDGFDNLTIAPGDVVSVTLEEWGLDAASYFVTASEVGEDWQVRLSLVEQPDGLYADTLVLPPLEGGVFIPAPPSDDPSLPQTGAPSGLAVALSAQNDTAPYDDDPQNGTFTWSAGDGAQGYEIQMRPAVETAPDPAAWCAVGPREFVRALYTESGGGDFATAGAYRWWVRSLRFGFRASDAVEGPQVQVAEAIAPSNITVNSYRYWVAQDSGSEGSGGPRRTLTRRWSSGTGATHYQTRTNPGSGGPGPSPGLSGTTATSATFTTNLSSFPSPLIAPSTLYVRAINTATGARSVWDRQTGRVIDDRGGGFGGDDEQGA